MSFSYEAEFLLEWDEAPGWNDFHHRLWIERGEKRKKYDEVSVRHIGSKASILTIAFTRSKKTEPSEVLSNGLRLRQLENIFLFLGLISRGRAPRLVSGELKPQNSSKEDQGSSAQTNCIPIPDSLRARFDQWSQVSCADLNRLWTIGDIFFLTGEQAGCLRVAASHIIWSHGRWEDEYSRLRDLWSAFNALYRYLAPQGARDRQSLRWLAEQMLQNGLIHISKVTVSVFQSEVVPILPSLSWGYVARKALTASSSGLALDCRDVKLFVDIDAVRRVNAASGNRLIVIESEIHKLGEGGSRQAGKDATAKEERRGLRANLNNEYRSLVLNYYAQLSNSAKQAGAVDTDVAPRLIVFICTQYLYQQRCSSMHGESSHKIFLVKDDETDISRRLNDLLESFITDVMLYEGTLAT